MSKEVQTVVNVPQETLQSKLTEIAKLIEENYTLENTCGGLTGSSGLATFMFLYAAYNDEDQYARVGQDILSHTIENALEAPVIPTYCSGLAGLGWMLEFLKEKELIEIDTDSLLVDLDEILFQKMITDFKENNYDVLHGALGYYFYFMKRQQRTASSKLKKQYTKYLLKGIDVLKATGVETSNTIYWTSKLPPNHDTLIANTGLSHGISSILSVLASSCDIPALRLKALPLLYKGLQFLFDTSNPINFPCIFPSWIDPNEKEPSYKGRIAWCYGDLGIALTFLKISKITEYEYLKEEAVKLLDITITARKAQLSGVVDAGFCHGAFGVAHCYGVAFEQLGLESYKREQDYWMYRALEMEQPEQAYAGFPMYLGMDQTWSPRLSLLEGIAGIGLVIIDYLNEERGTWDKALLL